MGWNKRRPNWHRYPIREAKHVLQAECRLCRHAITTYERYYDGGAPRRAHVACGDAEMAQRATVERGEATGLPPGIYQIAYNDEQIRVGTVLRSNETGQLARVTSAAGTWFGLHYVRKTDGGPDLRYAVGWSGMLWPKDWTIVPDPAERRTSK